MCLNTVSTVSKEIQLKNCIMTQINTLYFDTTAGTKTF